MACVPTALVLSPVNQGHLVTLILDVGLFAASLVACLLVLPVPGARLGRHVLRIGAFHAMVLHFGIFFGVSQIHASG